MKDKNIKVLLFYFSLIFIMVMSLNMAIVDSTGMDLPFAKTVFLTLIATAAASIAVLFPISLLAALLPGAGWIAYLYYTDAALISSYVQKTFDFFIWLYGYIVGYNFFEPGYSIVFALLYAAITALVVSLLVYSGKGGFVLIALGTAVLTFFWFIYVGKARLYLVLYLFASILLYSFQAYKRRLKEWEAADCTIEDNIGRNWMLCSGIVISASIILTLALPLNIKAVNWSWLNEKVVSVFPFIAEWRNDTLESFSYGFNSRYSLSSAGYKGRKLGGEVLLDETVMMTVQVQGEEPLYLRGAIKDKYSGNSWNKSSKGYKEYKPGSIMPLPFGSRISTYEKTLEITYKKLLTSTIFAPYSIYQVQHNSRNIYADEDSEVYTPKMTMRDEPYTVKSRMPYIDIEKLRQANMSGLQSNEIKLYTALDSDISERVKSLAFELTKGKSNAFDKAKAIERYLRQNYKYTLKPQKLPAKAEFTDHFLFEGKEGYCTYFATSMAVLLRASGVPCRYVEGFLAKYDGEDDRQVRGIDAHAWVEVYFDEYGWVNFEPTPQYPAVEFRENRDTAIEADADTIEAAARNNIDIPNISRRRRDMEEEEETGSGAMYGNDKKSVHLGNMAMLGLLSLILIRLVFMYLAWVMKELSLGRSKGQKFALNYIKDIIWYLRRAGFVMGHEETLREFLKRVRFNHTVRTSDISDITQMLEKTRYGGIEPDIEERKALEAFRKKVKLFAKKEAGVFRLFISLYLVGK